MRRFFNALAVCSIAVGLSACSGLEIGDQGSSTAEKPKPPASDGETLQLQPVSFSALTGWATDDVTPALEAFLRSCGRLQKQNPNQPVGGRNAPTLNGRAGLVADWLPICAEAGKAQGKSNAVVRRVFENELQPFLVTGNGDPDGLFTGYYVAELKGHWQRTERYRYPIYARPSDLVTVELAKFDGDLTGKAVQGRVKGSKLVPYASRADIDKGYLSGRGLEILYVDDPVDAFFMHVQGSGRVAMTDGSIVSLGFAGKNGQPYTSIGRTLIANGALDRDEVSMATIRAWLADNPDQVNDILWTNRSYVFFQKRQTSEAVGAEGVALTPKRSLAVDRSLIPYGVPIWLATTDPLAPDQPLRRLVVAQDTGGAIRGAVRGDLFWGYGDNAARRAGEMKQKGRYFLLLPKTLIGTQPSR